MPKILIVYHSDTGNTESMAKAIHHGAQAAGAEVSLKKASDADAQDILDCDGVAFGSPNCLHYMAGKLKDFFDRIWKKVGYQNDDKLYTTFSSAGSGETDAMESIDHVLSIFCEWKKVNFTQAFPGIIARGTPSQEVLEKCQEMGTKLARLLQ